MTKSNSATQSPSKNDSLTLQLSAATLARLQRMQKAQRELSVLDSEKRNKVLLSIAKELTAQSSVILAANKEDLEKLSKETPKAFRDRLTLSEKRLSEMADSLKFVARLPDPLLEVTESRTLENGLLLKKIRSPLGLLLMIFESRPNVTTEAFSLAFKSGNGMILRGGKESIKTVTALFKIISESLSEESVSPDVLWGIEDPRRSMVQELLLASSYIDVVIPRGGEQLIRFIEENTKIPVIKNDRGMCHVYVDEFADSQMALQIVENAKTQRPGVCNAMETLLVHKSLAESFLPKVYNQLLRYGIKWKVCPETQNILGSCLQPGSSVEPANEESWKTEYLDLIMNCKIVASVDEAINHIQKFTSRHSEAIITQKEELARRFQKEIDAAAVYWNASTRFTDGYQMGLGGEIGISTQKLHVRGPVGLRELTTQRWLIDGTGQIRS